MALKGVLSPFPSFHNVTFSKIKRSVVCAVFSFFSSFYEQLLSVTPCASCRICTLAVWRLNIVCEVVTSATYNIEKLAKLTELSTQCVTLACMRLQSTFYSALSSQSSAIWNNNSIPLRYLIGTKKESPIKIDVMTLANYLAILPISGHDAAKVELRTQSSRN